MVLVAFVREIVLRRATLPLENIALRQQVSVLKRERPRPWLRPLDRVFRVFLSRRRHCTSDRGLGGTAYPRSLAVGHGGAVSDPRSGWRIRAVGIRDRPIAPRSPWQNGHAERLIGSIRRECLDHIIIRGEDDLGRILGAYARYYDETRTHLALGKETPEPRPVRRVGRIVNIPLVGGVHHRYVRI